MNWHRLAKRVLLVMMAVALLGCGDEDSPCQPAGSPCMPASTLAERLDEQSRAVDMIARGWQEPIPGLEELREIHRAKARPGRSDGFLTPAYFQIAKHGMFATQDISRRIADMTMQLDRVSRLGTAIESDFGGEFVAALANPQWMASMMERMVYSQRIVAEYARTLQTLGLSELVSAVDRTGDAQSRLIAYIFLADRFNAFVESVCAWSGSTVDSDWLLETSSRTGQDDITTELHRVSDILVELPFGLPVRLARNDDFVIKHPNWVAFVAAIFGDTDAEFQFETWEPPIDVDWEEVAETIQEIDSLIDALTEHESLADMLVDELVDEVTGWISDNADASWQQSVIGCAIDLTKDGVTVFGATIAVTGSGGLVLLWDGSVLTSAGYSFTEQFLECEKPFRDLFANALEAMGVELPAPRKIPALTNPQSAECDQLRRATVERRVIDLDGMDGPDRFGFDEQTPEDARDLLAGRGAFAPTFLNLENAAAALLVDHGLRNEETVRPRVLGRSRLEFYGTDFAMLIYREPGSKEVSIPPIVEAQLVCTAPGFIPMVSDTVNLGEMKGLPEMEPITDLGLGGLFAIDREMERGAP